jgi:hypothetical protein
MKLNLLPKHVAKAQGSKGAFFVAIIIIAVCGALAFGMIQTGRKQLDEARAKVEPARNTVAQAMGHSAMADTVISRVTGIDRNLKLTEAMLAHNSKYIELYREVMAYIPSYYRINSLTATPTGPDTVSVSMSGVMQTHRQYADIIAALYRMPGVQSVSRSNYAIVDPYVPPLTEEDQLGTMIRPGEANLSSDPLERMAQLQQRAANEPDGFQGVGGFGTEQMPKGAMPDWSTVNITMVIGGKPMQVPNPRATLDQAAVDGGGNTPPPGFGGPGGNMTPVPGG